MRVLGILAMVAIASIRATSIDHDTVQPFAQPEPITDAEKAAIKFKPSLAVKDGCHPYPAVNAAGDTNAGLKGTGPSDGDCEGSPLGSQVYSRSTWFEGKWAIMYAWYFPKDMQGEGPIGFVKIGVRHDWVNLVAWLDNPTLAEANILATSASVYFGTISISCGVDNWYAISKPPKRSDIINGTTPKVRYDKGDRDRGHTIFQFHEEDGYQDLIQWTQLTDAAREALENTDFGDHAKVPISDAYFETNIKTASTYFECGGRYGITTRRSIWK